MKTKLTSRQEIFCREYLIDLNGTQAAIRSGYRQHSAKSQASRLLSNPNIQESIATMKQERCQRLSVSADYVLQQAVALHERCMQQIQPKMQRSKEVIDETGNTVYEFDATNALKALELIGKHVNIGAFKERMEMSGNTLNTHFVLAPIKSDKTLKFASTENEIEQ